MQEYSYDKDEIKNSLTIEQVESFVAELGGEPIREGDKIVCKTICHCGNSHKLYYYDNTKLWRCYTDCGGDAFDIFELTRKVKSREEPKIDRENTNWNLPEAIDLVARYFGFSENKRMSDADFMSAEDWKILNNYDRIKDINITTQEVELKEYDNKILNNLPKPIILPWLEEGITKEVMDRNGICYDPKQNGIVIPHLDMKGRLIGIRDRTLIKENEVYGKYRPERLNNQLYNHPLSFNLYNLNNSQNNIKTIKKAFVFEGEKSCLLYASYFGIENDLSVAVCGSSFIQYQAWLLINLGVEEIIICLDKQFKEIGDSEFKKLVKNLRNIYKKYGNLVKISFMFDKWDLIDYKSSPIDHGPEIFLELFNRRVNLYNEGAS